MADENITPNSNYQNMRERGQTVQKGLHQLTGVFHGIKAAAREHIRDPEEALEHIAMLADLGAEQASMHADMLSEVNDSIDDLDKPQIDMMQSALQADLIEKSLSALCQVIPEEETDAIGSIKTILKLANDLSVHLASGGRYRYVLKEAIDEAKAA